MVMLLIMSSCITDEVGPAGPQGEQGPQGESGFLFEFENVDFSAPDYEVFLDFPDDFETLPSDVAIVYFLWDVVEIDGGDFEVWRQLPQSVLTQDGTLQYNFDFSMKDVRLFMEADFDMDRLEVIDTEDWIVRVVVIPGEFWNSARVGLGALTYQEAEELFDLPKTKRIKKAKERRK